MALRISRTEVSISGASTSELHNPRNLAVACLLVSVRSDETYVRAESEMSFCLKAIAFIVENSETREEEEKKGRFVLDTKAGTILRTESNLIP